MNHGSMTFRPWLAFEKYRAKFPRLGNRAQRSAIKGFVRFKGVVEDLRGERR